jgi:hypothetical protein
VNESNDKDSKIKPDEESARLLKYVKAFLVPTLFFKGCILYFGLNYSRFPDEGYGWGLVASISLSLGNFAIFLYCAWRDDAEDSD